MRPDRWGLLVSGLDATDVDAAVKAASQIYQEAELEDIPRLLTLLESDDFFVREVAAWPLAELAGPKVLVELFTAYQRGFDEGHDNDGFTAALLEVPSLHREEAKVALLSIITTADEPMLGHAKWLLEFCEGESAAQ